MEDLQIAEKSELELQQQYVYALIKAKPGLRDKAVQIAQDLTAIGLSPNESLLLINEVYAPQDLEGKGQTTRLRYFSEAVREVYGESYLEKAANHPALFRGLVYQVEKAVEMRDEVNQSLMRTSLSFKDALRLHDLGESAETIAGYIDTLVSQGASETAAKMRLKEASEAVRMGKISTMEGYLFRGEFDDLTTMVMEDEIHDQ